MGRRSTKVCYPCDYIHPITGEECGSPASCHIGCVRKCHQHGYHQLGRCSDTPFDCGDNTNVNNTKPIPNSQNNSDGITELEINLLLSDLAQIKKNLQKKQLQINKDMKSLQLLLSEK